MQGRARGRPAAAVPRRRAVLPRLWPSLPVQLKMRRPAPCRTCLADAIVLRAL